MDIDSLKALRNYQDGDATLGVTTVIGREVLTLVPKKCLGVLSSLGWVPTWLCPTTTNLDRVCAIAMPTIRSISFFDFRAKDAVARLQQQVLRHCLTYNATPMMAQFLKEADAFLTPEPSIIRRIAHFVGSCVWPFGGPSLLSEKTAFKVAKGVDLKFHSPQIKVSQRGSVTEDQLY